MYEWEEIDFLDAGALVEERDPGKYEWGFYSKDTSTPEGVGAFSWFETLEELLKYLVNIEPRIWCYGVNGVNEEKYSKLKTKIQETLDEDGLNKGLNKGLRTTISNELDNGEISWWGRTSDLYAGRNSFSRQLIKGFVKEGNKTVKGNPKIVEEDQIPEFFEFCKGFGH